MKHTRRPYDVFHCPPCHHPGRTKKSSWRVEARMSESTSIPYLHPLQWSVTSTRPSRLWRGITSSRTPRIRKWDPCCTIPPPLQPCTSPPPRNCFLPVPIIRLRSRGLAIGVLCRPSRRRGQRHMDDHRAIPLLQARRLRESTTVPCTRA